VARALVRDPGKLSIEHPHLTVVRGDVLDYSAVEKAVRGHDADTREQLLWNLIPVVEA